MDEYERSELEGNSMCVSMIHLNSLKITSKDESKLFNNNSIVG